MNVTPSAEKITSTLAMLLATREKPTTPQPVATRYESATLADIVHGAGLDHQDMRPALDMTAKGGGAMERVRRVGLEAGKADKSAKRMAANRARAERKAQFDAIAASPAKPAPERLAKAWLIVTPLFPIIQKAALSKRAWASRFLGSNADDLASMATESIVLVLAKSDKDLDVLARAAEELGRQAETTGRMPGDQVTDDSEQAERRAVSKARKWLMGLVNNRIMGALVDSYTSQRNLRWDNIDLIATVMASINGPGDDPAIARHKADKAPAFMASRMAAPGRLDGNLIASAITGAITDRRLDPLVELLLDPEAVRTDGAFSWSKNAERVFLLSPEGGEQVWDLVAKATAHVANPSRARADAARTHVRNLFEWLPGLIVSASEAFDLTAAERYTICKRSQSTLSSGFDQYRAKSANTWAPTLTFATPQEAAAVIVEHLSTLVTGEDVVGGIVFA